LIFNITGGNGKSTIISLLERFYDIAKGSILIDGTPIDEFNIKSLRQQVNIENSWNIR
jgi:ABC-type multidrug transport system fused ATPase/permease subunit